MKPILIIKTGSTLPTLKKRKGDFEDWIIKGAGLPPSSFLVVDVEKGQTLPNDKDISSVIITGSHAMLTDHLAWSETAAQWLAAAVSLGIPTLGICYGHQLLAYALGGSVDYNPKGREYGMVELTLAPTASADPLLQILPASPKLYVCHSQTVTRLPEDAVLLAASARDSYQAFSYHSSAWGLQFHPEFDADITRTYIQSSQEHLVEEGQDLQKLMVGCVDSPLGDLILRRFVEIAA